MKIFDGLHAFLWSSMSANNCNTYLIDGPARILIDPGHLHLFSHVESGLREAGVSLGEIDLVITTHAHPDHFEAVRLFNDSPALFAMHREDWGILKEMARYAGAGFEMEAYTPDFYLQEGNLEIKGMQLQIAHTPGHSPGSVSIFWPERKVLFTGDVLFKDGLGRTDLPGGNGKTLKKSILKLSELDAEWLLPGHGGIIFGADEIKNNAMRVEQYWFGYI